MDCGFFRVPWNREVILSKTLKPDKSIISADAEVKCISVLRSSLLFGLQLGFDGLKPSRNLWAQEDDHELVAFVFCLHQIGAIAQLVGVICEFLDEPTTWSAWGETRKKNLRRERRVSWKLNSIVVCICIQTFNPGWMNVLTLPKMRMHDELKVPKNCQDCGVIKFRLVTARWALTNRTSQTLRHLPHSLVVWNCVWRGLSRLIASSHYKFGHFR